MPSSSTHGAAGRVALGLGLALACAAPAAAQEITTAARARITERAVIGGPTLPTSGVLRLIGAPARTAGQSILSISGAGDVTVGALDKADLPAAIAYEDEANTFTPTQTFSGNIGVNGGALTATGALSLTTGGALTLHPTGSLVLDPIGGALTAPGALSLTTGGPLTLRPTGSLVLDPTGNLVIGPDGLSVLPATGYTYNIGALTNKFLTLHAAELWVETLVAQNTIATIGGRILIGPTTPLTADLASGATSMIVKHNQMASGAVVYLEANGAVEWIGIASGPSGTGPYTYTITRNLDGSGANDWAAGDAVFNTGTTGKGWIDLYSVSGVTSGAGPTIAFNARTGSTYNQIATRSAIGNLNGLYGYAAATYGAAFGDPAAANLTIDATNGLRFRNGVTDTLTLTGSALNLVNAGVIQSGAASALSTGSGIWIDAGSGTPTFRIGDPAGSFLRWNGSVLALHETMFCLTCPGFVGTVDLDTNGLSFGATDGTPPFGATVYAPGITFTSATSGASGLLGYTRAGTQKGVALFSDVSSATLGAQVVIQADQYGSPTKHAALTLTTPAGSAAFPAVATLEAAAVELLGVAKMGQASTGGVPVVGVIGNTTTNPGYPWFRGDGNYLVLNADGTLYLNWDAGDFVVVGTPMQVRGAFYPVNTNTYSLGAAANRWSDIFFAEPTTTAAGLFPLVSNAGRVMAKSNGLNGTTTCAGAQRVSAITFAFGIATGITCS